MLNRKGPVVSNGAYAAWSLSEQDARDVLIDVATTHQDAAATTESPDNIMPSSPLCSKAKFDALIVSQRPTPPRALMRCSLQ